MQSVRQKIEVNDFVKEFRKLQQQLWQGLPSYWIGGLEQYLIAARELVETTQATGCMALWNFLHESCPYPLVATFRY